MAGRLKLAIRAFVGVLAALALAAGLGWLPAGPVVAAGGIAALVLAGEAFIAARGRRTREVATREALVDTSALIDGRLADVAAAGFLDLDLIVPEFVLAELQTIADASDPMRRARGRRGLDVLQGLRERERRPARVVVRRCRRRDRGRSQARRAGAAPRRGA